MLGSRSFAIAALAAFMVLPAYGKPQSHPGSGGPASPPSCRDDDLSGNVVLACEGFLAGNLLAGSPGAENAAAQALAMLGLEGSDGRWVVKHDDLSSALIELASPLYGISYIGIHKGGAGEGGPGTALYQIDAGEEGLRTLQFNRAGLGALAVYATGVAPTSLPEPKATTEPIAVPEPATMLLAGLGLLAMGVARRRG